MSPDGRTTAWERAPVGLLRLDPDGTVLDANQTVLTWVGRTPDEVTGRVRLSELMSVGGRIYWETHLAPLLRMQGRVDEVAVELRGPGGRLPVLMTAVVRSPAAADADGTGAMIDVALSAAGERSRYERELVAARAAAERSADQVQALQQATAALSQALGVDGVARALLSTAVRHLGAASADLFLVGDGGGLVHHRSHGEVGDRAPVSPAQHLVRISVPVEVDGLVHVPLRGRSQLHGALTLAPRTDAAAEPLDLDVLSAVGQQTGLALERALLYDESASVAHELQHALITTVLPTDRRFAITTVYRPGVEALEVGGDWYDAFMLDDDVLAVVVGDVVGRGLHAATAMGQLRSAVRAVAALGVSPAALVSRVDRFVRQTGVGFMTTLVYAELDLRSGRMRYACAGHLPPLRLSSQGGPQYLWDGRSTPLGVGSPTGRGDAEHDLTVGDAVVLYTDGLVERRHRSLLDGLDVLSGAGAGLRDQQSSLAAERVTAALTEGAGERDDVCVLVLSWRAQGGGPSPGDQAEVR